jgi:hypothetical protein
MACAAPKGASKTGKAQTEHITSAIPLWPTLLAHVGTLYLGHEQKKMAGARR